MSNQARYVVRAFALTLGDEIVYSDSRPLYHATAQRLVKRLKQADNECLDAVVLTLRDGCVPPAYGYRRVQDIASTPVEVEGEQHKVRDSLASAMPLELFGLD